MSAMPVPDVTVLGSLNGIAQVDPGEAILIAVCLNNPTSLFITGDKRALRAVAKHPLAARLAGKVALVEQVLKLCLEQKGREWLLANIQEHRGIDKAISMIVGSRCDASLENLNTGLASYISEIKTLCNPSMVATDLVLNLT
ncbi:hypothetical protein [Massilia sp. X63]|uniref:hypothetical protein n=1 Tax=Massilia sp. X63 TaxID=3237285 RepID=UPI0034DCE652